MQDLGCRYWEVICRSVLHQYERWHPNERIRYDVNCFSCASCPYQQNTSANRTNCNGGGTEALGNGAGAVVAFGVGAAATVAVATAGAAMAAGASGMAGGAHAVMTAFSQASALESGDGGEMLAASSGGDSGGSALASAMGGDSGVSSQSNTGISQSGGASAGSNAKGSVAAKAARIASGTVSNLVQGALDVARDSAKGRVSETTGGKIAAAIEARGTTSNSGTNDGNSLSAGTGTSETSVTHHGILVNPQQQTGTS